MPEEILRHRDGDITFITINRAADGNRVSDEMAVQLTEWINEAAASSRAIVMRGAGDEFCLGRAMMGRPGDGALPEAYDLRDNNKVVFNFYGAFRDSPVPVIGAVQGGAYGFGCAIAALCDVTIAGDKATFQLPEMGHNIMPTMAMSSLVDRVSRKAIMHLTYSTKIIGAAQALACGLVSDVVPAEELDDEVDRFLEALKKAPMPAVKAVKEYARSALTMDVRAATDFAQNLHATVNTSSKMHP